MTGPGSQARQARSHQGDGSLRLPRHASNRVPEDLGSFSALCSCLAHQQNQLTNASTPTTHTTFCLHFWRSLRITNHPPIFGLQPFAMVASTIFEAPMPESFKTREDHETQTPESFYLGKPVLHYRAKDVTVVMTAHHFPAPDIFDLPCAASPEDPTRITEKIDIMVTSQYVLLLLC